MTNIKNTKIAALLTSNNIEIEEIGEVTIMDLYCFVDTDMEELIDVLSEYADMLHKEYDLLPQVKPTPYEFLDIYSDYYNETAVQVEMAIKKSSFSALEDVTMDKLFSIQGICSSNMKYFVSIIINKFYY